MRSFIKEVLENRGENYILPFFWQHGEKEEVLRDYMRAIQGTGIGAVCLEARPHPDYAGPLWWRDVDIIMDEARKRGMKVWILDDAHFPTGYANGKMPEEPEEKCKQYLAVNRTEVCGPLPQADLCVEELSHVPFNPFAAGDPFLMEKDPRHFDDDSLVAVVAARLTQGEEIASDFVDLTDRVQDGWLTWDVPDGVWRFFVIFKTRNGGGNTHYINMLDEASCRVQIDAVYEPHYEHYKDDFGKTLAGFFSDEPALGNTTGFNFNESIGKRIMNLPWNKDMDQMMVDRLGRNYTSLLPALWADTDDEDLTARVRYAYMDAMTELVGRNFSLQIGDWCAAHGVEYIGHIVEDHNQHTKMGSSQGHFFRSMAGQHMAGIDDIGNQVLPGGEDHRRLPGFSIGGEGEFFNFELSKLGPSFAHIDPRKKGRVMCEIYGAYGWETGVRTMKYLTDHFLVSGVNYYVPHAFSPKDFPDVDCPPHFYAHGENPQYRHFGKLMHYLNRMCHIFNGGQAIVPVAVLYHGDAEWTGGYMKNQTVGRQLLEHQIDFDIVPSDVFSKPEYFGTRLATVDPDTVPEGAACGDVLIINGNTYGALVIPYSQYITKAVAEFAAAASKSGVAVYFVDDLPDGICDVANAAEAAKLLAGLDYCLVSDLEDLADDLAEDGLTEISMTPVNRRLRAYHYVHDGAHIYMFNNEEPGKAIVADVTVPVVGPAYGYDAMENRLTAVDVKETAFGSIIHLELPAYESAVIIFDDAEGELADTITLKQKLTGTAVPVEGTWKVSVCDNKSYPDFKPAAEMDKLASFARISPDFSGWIRYENTLKLDAAPEGAAVLEITDAYEGAEVFVNGKSAGMRIAPPFRFDVSGLLAAGENAVSIEVATTLYRRTRIMPETKSPFGNKPIPIAPTGLLGEVKVYLG